MKIRKAIAIVLACTMLMGQTVWAQEVRAKLETQSNEEMRVDSLQEDSEQEAQQTDENAEVIVEDENIEEKEMTEKSVYAEANDDEVDDDIEIEEETICVNYPITITAYHSGQIGESECSVEIGDENICKVVSDIYISDSYYSANISFVLEGISAGKTMLYLKLDNSIIKQYEITVNELPDNAVMFNDLALRNELVRDSAGGLYDKNFDHCIDRSEMENIRYLDCRACGVKDLSGLEYATNLSDLNLSGNAELTDISVLFGLEFLKSVDLVGTGVSDEDRWKLAGFEDNSVALGEKIMLPALGNIFEEGLTVEVINGNEYVKIEKYEEGDGEIYTLLAKEIGEVKLKISYSSYSTEITITIQGISPEQEVGEDYDVEINFCLFKSAEGNSYMFLDNSVILDNNNQLWQIYPTGEKIQSNVKEYVIATRYDGNYFSEDGYVYLLDTDNTLWDGSTKLAEDVVKFSGRYALDGNGVLKNIYYCGSEQIEGVENWAETRRGETYMLKKDGTLWKRQEVPGNQTLLEWELFESDVQQVTTIGYLKKDGTVIYFGVGKISLDVIVSRIYPDGTFYDLEGNYYLGYDCPSVGKLDIKEYAGDFKATYLLTTDDNVYKYDNESGITTLILTDVIQMVRDAGLYESDEDVWAFQLSDGTYCDEDGNPMSEVKITDFGEYNLIFRDGDNIVEKNGITLLNRVTEIWWDYQEDGEYLYFALRTDGTVWNITGIPEQVLDLKQTEEEIKGDLNGDSEINLLDLMQCLNHVSKKSLLEETTYTAADIDGNGTVDLLDLMRILNYVSKKTTEL